MPVGNLFEYIHAQPLPEFHHPLLMAGGAEMTALAGEGQKILMYKPMPANVAGNDVNRSCRGIGSPSRLLEQVAEEVPDATHSLAEGIHDGVHGMARARFLRRCPREVSLPQRLRA